MKCILKRAKRSKCVHSESDDNVSEKSLSVRKRIRLSSPHLKTSSIGEWMNDR